MGFAFFSLFIIKLRTVLSTKIINKRSEPVIFYYNSEKGKSSVRVKGGESTSVEGFISVSPASTIMVNNNWVEIVLEDRDIAMSVGEKMKKAAEDIELYMNQAEQ